MLRLGRGPGVLVIATVLCVPLRGQANPWSTGSGGAIYYDGGNVGIGTASPSAGLTVNRDGNALFAPFNILQTARFKTGANGAIVFDSGSTATYNLRALYFPFHSTRLSFSRFDSTSSVSPVDDLTIDSTGNVGIGTTGPQFKLDVGATTDSLNVVNINGSSTGQTRFRMNIVGLANAEFTQNFTGSTDTYGVPTSTVGLGTAQAYPLVFTTSAAERMRIDTGGNVGIGTTAPQYKLAVNGTIGTKEVVVTNTGWADYVLRPGYPLKPLSQIEAFIRQNHRLPDIPSEKEVQEKGVGLGDMQVKLLAKVEELTLHMIELEKQNRTLQEKVARLEGAGAH